MIHWSFAGLVLTLLFSPLVFGVVNRTKAFFAGRKGQPLVQLYRDLWRLLWKSAVYSRTTTWIFKAGPIVGLASTLTAFCLLPQYHIPALVAFPADFLLLFYLLGLGRFFLVSAALDTGSAFEGMGAGVQPCWRNR